VLTGAEQCDSGARVGRHWAVLPFSIAAHVVVVAGMLIMPLEAHNKTG
jgi:hypothetical protein